MKRKNYSKLKRNLQKFSSELYLVSNLMKILVDISQDASNIKEIDKIGLTIIIDKLIDKQKYLIENIRTRAFGID